MNRRAVALSGLSVALCIGGVIGWMVTRPPPIDPLVEVGRRIFTEGRLADGSYTEATAYSDVALSGAQVSCTNCHGRSGMGTAETGTRTPPITGPMLFNPAERPRGPIYSTTTLARALRGGIDSAGEPLSPLMPRYKLSDADIAALAAYLRTLSREAPPGIDDGHLYIATAISDEVPAETRESVLSVLQRFADDHNVDSRNETGRNDHRIERGRTRKLFREWVIVPWTLQGPPEAWPAQLEAHQEEQPVFAMVGGLSTHSWAPVHAFCEAEAMPCLFPSVERAPTQPGDFYAIYFSDGLGIEARVMAAELQAEGAGDRVVQLVAPGDPAGAEAARLLTERLAAAGGAARTLAPGDGTLPAALREASAVVSWLSPPALATLTQASPQATPLPLLLLSGTRLGPERDAALPGAPAARPGAARIVDARANHRGRDPGRLRFAAWAKGRDIPLRHEQLQAQAWFAAMALFDGMEHIGTHPGRAYLLDTLDHSSGLAAVLPSYPEGEFGPGQRTLSKGAWVVPVDGAAAARWVLP